MPQQVRTTNAAPPRLTEDARNFIYEQLGFLIINAEIAQRHVEIGDMMGLEYSLRRLIAHVRTAAGSFNDIRNGAPDEKRSAA